jgi:hypothetical protein
MSIRRLSLILLIAPQLLWLLAQLVLPHFGHGPPSFDESYRGEERDLAYAASLEHPSQQTKAAWDEEVRRLDRHVLVRDWLVFGFILVLDGAAVYLFWRLPPLARRS